MGMRREVDNFHMFNNSDVKSLRSFLWLDNNNHDTPYYCRNDNNHQQCLRCFHITLILLLFLLFITVIESPYNGRQ